MVCPDPKTKLICGRPERKRSEETRFILILKVWKCSLGHTSLRKSLTNEEYEFARPASLVRGREGGGGLRSVASVQTYQIRKVGIEMELRNEFESSMYTEE